MLNPNTIEQGIMHNIFISTEPEVQEAFRQLQEAIESAPYSMTISQANRKFLDLLTTVPLDYKSIEMVVVTGDQELKRTLQDEMHIQPDTNGRYTILVATPRCLPENTDSIETIAFLTFFDETHPMIEILPYGINRIEEKDGVRLCFRPKEIESIALSKKTPLYLSQRDQAFIKAWPHHEVQGDQAIISNN